MLQSDDIALTKLRATNIQTALLSAGSARWQAGFPMSHPLDSPLIHETDARTGLIGLPTPARDRAKDWSAGG